MNGFVSLKDAEKQTGVKGATIRAWVNRGDVAGVTGRPFLVHIKDLDAYIMQRANIRARRLYSNNADVATAA